MIYSRSSSPFRMGGGRRRSWLPLWITIVVVLFFAVFVYTPLPSHYDNQRDAIIQQVAQQIPDSLIHDPNPKYPSLETTKSKYAYATFLADDHLHPDDPDSTHDDYFVATRILAYQILHAPETRSYNNIPLVVLVTAGVTEDKRERLRKDGAIVIEAETIPKPAWIEIKSMYWQDVFDKLRLWELTQFDRIAFLDGDTILTKPLDDIFEDPAVILRPAGDEKDKIKSDEGLFPSEYVFAGQPELQREHNWPPSEENEDYPNINYLNAGFFVMKPSKEVLDYYLSIMQIPDRFDPELPEQNLLNYAHRREGNMPWKQLDTKWNIHYPTIDDLEGGVASLHDKWWAPSVEDLAPYEQSWRWRMEGFYEAMDETSA